MARPLRIERPNAWYHLTARGNERQPIYRDARDYQHFCDLLADAVERFRWRLHAYVLMKNHFHLFVETLDPNLSRSMQWLGVSYTVWFNRRRARSGHLFQGRFKSIIVDPVDWGVELSRYLHLNPVRVSSLSLSKRHRAAARTFAIAPPDPEVVRQRLERLRKFRWSSYRAYIGAASCPQWLTCEHVLGAMGSGSTAQRQRRYQEHVECAVRQGLRSRPWDELRAQLVLGSEKFLRKVREVARGDAREQPAFRRLGQRPTWTAVVAAVEALAGEKWDAVQDRHGDPNRDLALYLGRKHCQLKLAELGALAGGMGYPSVAMAIRRFEQRLTRDKKLAKHARTAVNEMYNVKI